MMKTRILIDPILCIAIAFSMLLLPIKWVLGWIMAAAVHEASHYIALKICGVQVFEIDVGLFGAVMEAETMPEYKEAICAAAGPLGGLLLVPFYVWVPAVSVCAMIQSLYNLLPLHPMDGGRILSGILRCTLGEHKASYVMRLVTAGTFVCFVAIGLYLWFEKKQGPLPLVVLILLTVKSIAKHLENN